MANIILTGLNGYGSNFVRELLQDKDNKLVAVISGAPEKSIYYPQLMERGIHFYKNIEECLAKELPDMAIICTPMHIHYKEVMVCLEKGVSVYCEKPLTTTVDTLLEVKRLAKETDAIVAVGFQWSFSDGIQMLKRDILAGKYGKIKSIKTIADWVRPISYYTDSSWKGRNIDASGQVIFDSVVSNPTAHYLHNMLFVCGTEMTRALDVDGASYEASAYRAHDIETFDTLSMKIKKDDLQIGFWGTLVSDKTSPVEFEAVCEGAKIVYPYDEEMHIAAIKQDGTVILYDNPDKDRFGHYKEVAEAIKEGSFVACDVETAEPFQQVIEYLRLNLDVTNFPEEHVVKTENSIVVKGLSERLRKAYLEEKNLTNKSLR